MQAVPAVLSAALGWGGKRFCGAEEAARVTEPNELDAAGIAALARGDDEAWNEFVLSHQDYVSAVMWRFANRADDLPDLVHDVFVEVYAGIGRFRPGARVRPWLRGVGVHVGYRYWTTARRKSNVELPLDSVAEIAARSEAAGQAEAKAALDSLLGLLSPRDRLVLTLLYVEQHSVAETAALTGWSASMVKVQAFRARARLRKHLRSAEVAE